MTIITIAGIDAHLSRKQIKNINLRIDRDGRVRVSAPLRCSLTYIQQFICLKKEWIIKHQARVVAHVKPDISNLDSYRQQMQALLPALIQKWEKVVGVKVNQWCIKAMKTRWGSCNPSQKRICLNLHLMQYPLVCLEYVVVHELVHLHEASHNHRFYALMSQFMPEWKEHRKLLKLSQSLVIQ